MVTGVRDPILRSGLWNAQGQGVRTKFWATWGRESGSNPYSKRLGTIQKVWIRGIGCKQKHRLDAEWPCGPQSSDTALLSGQNWLQAQVCPQAVLRLNERWIVRYSVRALNNSIWKLSVNLGFYV